MKFYVKDDYMVTGLKRLKDDISRYTKVTAFKYDTEIALNESFIEKIRNGAKTHTMKFHQIDGKDVIRLPAYRRMPLLNRELNNAEVGKIDVDYVAVKQWSKVNTNDAIGDGFDYFDTFRMETERLATQRGFSLMPSSYVSFFHIAEMILAE